MKRLFILLLSFLISGFATADSGERETYIPNAELVNFILQAINDSVPQPWYSVRMVATVGKTDDGKNLLEAKYTYKSDQSSADKIFTVSNVFGPLNAVSRLQKQMAAEGKKWSTITIQLMREGGYEVNVK
jgi:hypothetical protein